MNEDFLDEEPVILDPGRSFIPSRLFDGEVWRRVPGGGMANDYFIRLPGYKPWFAIFMRATGCFYSAYYPVETMRKGQRFNCPITFCNDLEPILQVIWTHETAGLANEVLEEIMFHREGL